MFRLFLDDPLFRGIPRPELTGSPDLTGITFAVQRPSWAGITAGGKSHRPTWNLTTGRSESMSSRRADDKPETAADKKFFDLRESGYKGPVDHNGNAVEDMAQWIRDHS